jgi:hypothetical protein
MHLVQCNISRLCAKHTKAFYSDFLALIDSLVYVSVASSVYRTVGLESHASQKHRWRQAIELINRLYQEPANLSSRHGILLLLDADVCQLLEFNSQSLVVNRK